MLFGKPSKAKFASLLQRAISRINPQVSYRYDPEQFCLVRDDGDGMVNLYNMYHEHCALPRKARKPNIVRLASIFATTEHDLPETLDEVRENFRPKIWSRSTFSMMELRAQISGDKEPDIPLYPLGGHLYLSLVFDTENSMRTISNDELENWGVTYYEAMEIARQNLEDDTQMFAKMGDNFVSSMTGDNYDSARIVLLDRIREFEIDGPYIAVAPQRDSLLVCSEGDEESVTLLLSMTAQIVEDEPRPLSPLPLKLVDDEWVDWQPPAEHPARSIYDDLELHFLGQLYSEQKELLDQLSETNPINTAFAASFSAIQDQSTENLLSYCVWGEGVDSLLPRTQIVVLINEDGMQAAGEWEKVASIVNDLLVPDRSYYPIRYRCREFPSQHQLEQIGKMPPFDGGNES